MPIHRNSLILPKKKLFVTLSLKPVITNHHFCYFVDLILKIYLNCSNFTALLTLITSPKSNHLIKMFSCLCNTKFTFWWHNSKGNLVNIFFNVLSDHIITFSSVVTCQINQYFTLHSFSIIFWSHKIQNIY